MGKEFIRASQGNVRQGEDMACRSLLEALKDVPDPQGQRAGVGVPADVADKERRAVATLPMPFATSLLGSPWPSIS